MRTADAARHPHEPAGPGAGGGTRAMTLDDLFPSRRQTGSAALASDPELRALADAADGPIQRIQDAIGRDHREAAKIRFPRGYLREAGRWRTALGFVRSRDVLNNVAYTLMMHDVQAWVLRRTDLSGHARDMLVKAAIASLGGVAEGLLIDATTPPMGRRQKVGSRIVRLYEESVLDDALRDDLVWLWGVRNRQHLYDLNASEFDVYTADDHPRAEASAAALILALQRHRPVRRA